MKYRRRTQGIIEAIKVTEALKVAANDWSALPDWLKNEYEKGGIIFCPGEIYIRQSHIATALDYLIYQEGQIYPVNGLLFIAIYEPLEEPL